MTPLPENCIGCPYEQSVKVPYKGDRNAEIMIVGEAPGKTEEQRGEPFCGKSGQVINALLNSIKYPREGVFIANSARCLLKKESTKADNEALRRCRSFLLRAINVVKPKLIIAHGAFALQQLLGKKKIMSNRGRMFRSEEFNAPVFVTVHPAFVLRGCQRGFPNIPFEQMSMKEKVLFQDYKLVRAIIDGGFKEVKIDTSKYVEGTLSTLKNIRKNYKIVSVDYESTSADLFHPDTKLICMSFTVQEGESHVYLLGRDKRIDDLVREILADESIVKIVAARPFEETATRLKLAEDSRCYIPHLVGEKPVRKPVYDLPKGKGRAEGIEAHNFRDVLTMAHVLDENYPAYNLETVANTYTELRNIKDLAEGMRFDLGSATKETVIRYNGVDTDATFRAYNKMKSKLLDDKKLARYYLKFICPVQDMIADISLNGVLVDRKKLRDNEKKATDKMGELEHQAFNLLHKSIRDKYSDNLKLTRTAIVADHLFNHPKGRRFKPLYTTSKTGALSTAEGHIKLFADRDAFVKVLLDWRKLQKIVSSYLATLPEHTKHDGRIYPQMLLTRTVTGRTVAINPAIQTYPQRGENAKLIKEAIVADCGYLFGARDLSQSELRIIGWQAQDQNILKALANKIDLHTNTAREVLGRAFRVVEVTKDLRHKAKPVNFGKPIFC